MRSEWIAKYEETDIRITNSWITGEKLFVNNELQDEKLSYLSSSMSGFLVTIEGKRLNIKTNISGFFRVGCRLFINHKKVDLIQIK